MKKISMTVLLSALALTGCMMNDEDPYPKTKIVTPNIVVGCKYIGNLTSSSQNYGLFDETANKARIKNAKKEGYQLGATHIVLSEPVENGNTTITTGKAYVCPNGN